MPNKIFIISGPSGSGQDSVIQGLKKILPIERVITTTTRPKRPGESRGRPYFFISSAAFSKKIKEKKFLEYAKEYNGHYYGVTRAELNRVKRGRKIGIWKIEYQGVMAVKKIMPEIIAILITAPLTVLKERIKARDKASGKYLKDRMTYTKKWLKHKDIYDYAITNQQGKLDQTIEKVAEIIKKHLN